MSSVTAEPTLPGMDPLLCAACQYPNPPAPRFCGACVLQMGEGGRTSAPDTHPATPEPQTTPVPTGERKQVTVLAGALAAKQVIQVAAVLGKEVPAPLLQAVLTLPDAAQRQSLLEIQAAEILYEIPGVPASTYTFKHALLQEVAYASLLTRSRQQVHQCVAQVLEAQFPATVETRPKLLAQHYTAAGLSECAVGYWQKAGQRANERASDRAPHQGPGRAHNPPGHCRTRATRDPAAGHAERSPVGNEGVYRPRSQSDVGPSVGVVSAGRREPTTLPSLIWNVSLCPCTGRIIRSA